MVSAIVKSACLRPRAVQPLTGRGGCERAGSAPFLVGDGDPHSIIRPETVAPGTPTETLQQVLARDDGAASATTVLRERSDPAARLCDVVQRYADGLHVAAEQLVGPQTVQMLDTRADQVVPTSPSSRPGRPCGHICSPWRPRRVSTHSCTCTQRPLDENSTPLGTWPPCWTGASQNPHPQTQDRFPGFPAFRKRSRIIPFGANIWRSGPS
jgi:hypothetical protein